MKRKSINLMLVSSCLIFLTVMSSGFYSASAFSFALDDSETRELELETLSLGSANTIAEKIAVFFWASDAGTQAVIDEYWAILQDEGYTVMYNFEDTADFEADFDIVEAYEGVEDTIFFYLFGHGNNNGEDSLTAFAPGSSVVYSSELRVMFDRLDAERICFLIESCHSGGFPLDFQSAPYLAMSTSDEDHNSYALSTIPGEGKFSNYFFEHVEDGYNAVDSFHYAEGIVLDVKQRSRRQYPIIVDFSDYVWFA